MFYLLSVFKNCRGMTVYEFDPFHQVKYSGNILQAIKNIKKEVF